MAESPPLSPAEVAVCSEERPRVGGRVLALERDKAVLADALGRVNLTFRSVPNDIKIGDFAVVEGCPGPNGLSDAKILQRYPAPTPQGDGEFSRFALEGVGKRLSQRSEAFAEIRDYLDGNGFIEIDAPLLVPAPGLDSFVEPVPCGEDFLSTSPEFQLKRLLAGGLPKVFSLGHVARADESGPWHEREYCMLEWYRTYCTAAAMRQDTEELLARVATRLTGARSIPLADGRHIPLKPPFERISVREAFKKWAGVHDAAALAEEDEARYFQLFVDSVEPALARLDCPIFLEEYPATQAALARLLPGDATVAERFELFIGGIELSNGFVELTDSAEQQSRFESEQRRRLTNGQLVPPLDLRFLAALAQGMPPCAGNALGVDRLVALCLGQAEIGRVMPFPRHWL